MKKFALPLGAGVVVFGVVTAFAASLTVNTSSLAAGNATVAACKDAAAVAYNTTGSTVTSATVTFSGTGAGCDTLTAKVTLTGTGPTLTTPVSGTGVVGSVTPGVATVNFTGVDAHDVTGVSVAITG